MQSFRQFGDRAAELSRNLDFREKEFIQHFTSPYSKHSEIHSTDWNKVIIQLFLENGADENQAAGRYCSALTTTIYADHGTLVSGSEIGNNAIVQLLLKNRANINLHTDLFPTKVE